jgi:hypothetical protein
MPYTYNPFIEGLDYYKNPPVLSGTISDHGQLTGLSDDDHLQYHSDVRGDVRYYTKTSLNAGQLDNRYYTESEVDALTWTESDITDLDKYTQAEVDTISGSLNNKIDIYKTIYIDAAAMVPCTTFGALQGTNEYSTNDIDMDYFAFDSGSTEERVQFKLKLPENWNLGTIKVKFDWSSATGSTAGDTVEWAIKAGALSNSDAIDAALGTPQVISDALLADNGTDLQTTSATPALTVGGTPTKNDLLIFEVYRNTDGTDDQYKKSGSTTAW